MRQLILAILFLAAPMSTVMGQLDDRTYTVTTILTEPFTMKAKGGGYEGYCIDLINAVTKHMGIRFKIQPVKDSKYGSRQADGTWNGMVGEVMRAEADMAVAPLTISSARERVIDFSKPFMATGITAISKLESVGMKQGHLMFLAPFNFSVWIMILICFVVFCMTMFLIKKFNPRESRKSSEADGKPESAADQIQNSFWIGATTLTWQGFIRPPRSVAGRLLVIFWFFFVMFTLVLYTAAMMNVLKLAGGQQKIIPFAGPDDIAKTINAKPYVIGGGSTFAFFKTSKVSVYETLYSKLKTVNSMEQGYRLINREDKSVLFGESITLQYYIQKGHCDFVQIGGLLDSKGYGIATRMGSKLRTYITLAILDLRETGVLQKLEKKWFDKGKCVKNPNDVYLSKTQWKANFHGEKGGVHVSAYQFAGILMFFVIGLVLSGVAFVVEIKWERKKQQKKEENQKDEKEAEGHDDDAEKEKAENAVV